MTTTTGGGGSTTTGGGGSTTTGGGSTTTTGVPAGGPVPAGTRATSITFVSSDTGFLLGTAPCSHVPCSVILRTRDRGRSWRGLPAPREAVSNSGGSGLWGLRFADAVHGYAFGRGLWRTATGGAYWTRAHGPAAIVLSLAAVQDRELVAIGAACLPSGQGPCSGALTLYHRPLASGGWQAVQTTRAPGYDSAFAVHGADVWALVGTTLMVSTDGGASFASNSQPCQPNGSRTRLPTSVTDDGPHVFLLCVGQGAAGSTAKYLYSTSGPGSPWTLAGRPPRAGDGGELSAGSDGALMIATASGASWLYRSTDGGRTWTTVLQRPGGAQWGDLGFTNAADAVVIRDPAVSDGGDSALGRVLLSDDGGATWSALRF